MTKYARINDVDQNGKRTIFDLISIDPKAAFHPSIAGLFETVPDETTALSYLQDGEWVHPSLEEDAEVSFPEATPISADHVQVERERRLAVGFVFDFDDTRGEHRIATTAADMKSWVDEVTPYANALVATGDTEKTISILTETGLVEVTGLEWQEILIAAGEFRQPIWQAFFALIAMDPIPEDYVDDGYWP